MADLSQGSFANVVLNAGESVRVITSGTATVESKYGAPAGTTTVTANSKVFGPYLVPAKLRVTAVTGSLSYVQGSRVAVTQDPITGEFQPSVSGAGNGTFPSYAGQIATRSRVPNYQVAVKSFNCRSWHRSRAKVTSIDIWLANFAVLTSGTTPTGSGAETGPGGTTTFTCAVEKMDGTRVQATFNNGAATSGEAADGGMVKATCAVSLDDGEAFYVRVYAVTNGTVMCFTKSTPALDSTYTRFSEGGAGSGSVLSDLTMVGTITNSFSVGVMYYPIAIVGQTTKASVLLLGDSRVHGLNDAQDASGDIGHMERSIGPQAGYINGSTQADRAFWLTTNSTNRVALAAYVTHVIHALGINDLRSDSKTAAQVLGYQATIRGLVAAVNPSARQWQSTIYPASTSTDSWATTANQTTHSSNTQRVSLNGSIRTTVFSNQAGILDIADLVESYRDSGVFLSNGQGNYYTADGLHLKQNGELMVARTGAIAPTVLVR